MKKSRSWLQADLELCRLVLEEGSELYDIRINVEWSWTWVGGSVVGKLVLAFVCLFVMHDEFKTSSRS